MELDSHMDTDSDILEYECKTDYSDSDICSIYKITFIYIFSLLLVLNTNSLYMYKLKYNNIIKLAS